MPRETIELGLSNPFTIEPMAKFLTFLAYPDPADSTPRAEFCSAISRFAIAGMCDMDPEWASSPQSIRPGFFLGSHLNSSKALRAGCTKLKHRFIAAAYFAMPHLVAQLQGCELVGYEQYQPTVENLAHLALERLGWEGDSASTVKSRMWGPSRPVVHAAAMLVVDGLSRELPVEDSDSWILPYFRDSELLRNVLLTSEIARLHLPLVKQFRIKEEDTIKFLP
jgi:hypothetical protein